ncbi:conserved hypothetical protein [Treponema primitia ZAS-2]|uniref:DUF86 domain-containing protein n=1 Tax=Treponema primitia (strain ATCC BAA-887 / DSM 12427 / ZAS-2) TaxID=545694 RepID=F5YN59_TREPZ|nr:hypothetical protein [Treponema primitia]AEF84954.1 conserved hypothetical protein [Treponema primitia ZAS-2]
MGDLALENLQRDLGNLNSSLTWLRRSFERCTVLTIKDEYTDDEYDQFENLTSRYARTTDLLISKLFRSLDTVELTDSGSIIDAANRAEKRGIIDSVSALRELKDLRNEITHEYEPNDLKDLFAAVLEATPRVFSIAERFLQYCERYTRTS